MATLVPGKTAPPPPPASPPDNPLDPPPTHTTPPTPHLLGQVMALQLDDANPFRFHWPMACDLQVNRWPLACGRRERRVVEGWQLEGRTGQGWSVGPQPGVRGQAALLVGGLQANAARVSTTAPVAKPHASRAAAQRGMATQTAPLPATPTCTPAPAPPPRPRRQQLRAHTRGSTYKLGPNQRDEPVDISQLVLAGRNTVRTGGAGGGRGSECGGAGVRGCSGAGARGSECWGVGVRGSKCGGAGARGRGGSGWPRAAG